MGANSAKVDSPEEEEFKILLLKTFQVQNIKDIGTIDASKLQKVWSLCLDNGLIDLLTTYFERKIVSRKKYDDKRVFYNIFKTLIHGNDSEMAEFLCCLFSLKRSSGTPEGCDLFEIDELEKYVSLLFSSFMKSLKSEEDHGYKKWTKGNAGFSEDIKKSVIQNLLKDLDKDKMVSRDSLEAWIMRCPLFLRLQGDVFKKAYCYHEKIGAHQTNLPVPDFTAVSRTRLDVHHVVYLTNHLLPDFKKKWRLLYSSRYSGESWVIFLKSILDQGPTFLFIWDKNNRCFGGFASSSWSLSPHFYGDDNCFLFSLLPSIDKFEPTNYNKNFQYINSAQATFPNGLGMGGQLNYWGLYIDSSMKFGKVSKSCSTFANYQQLSEETFEMEDIEVWGVGEKPVPLEPEVRQRSVLDSQTDAKAVLEMMGKSQVSAGLREPVDIDD